jgi:hypothetical protein
VSVAHITFYWGNPAYKTLFYNYTILTSTINFLSPTIQILDFLDFIHCVFHLIFVNFLFAAPLNSFGLTKRLVLGICRFGKFLILETNFQGRLTSGVDFHCFHYYFLFLFLIIGPLQLKNSGKKINNSSLFFQIFKRDISWILHLRYWG